MHPLAELRQLAKKKPPARAHRRKPASIVVRRDVTWRNIRERHGKTRQDVTSVAPVAPVAPVGARGPLVAQGEPSAAQLSAVQ